MLPAPSILFSDDSEGFTAWASRALVGSGLAAILLTGLVSPHDAIAQTEAEHEVSAQVEEYREVIVDSPPRFSTSSNETVQTTATYALVTNAPRAEAIEAEVQGDPPEGVAVRVYFEPPPGAEAMDSDPIEVLSRDGEAEARTLVQGVGQTAADDLEVTYETEVGIEAEPGDVQIDLVFRLAD